MAFEYSYKNKCLTARCRTFLRAPAYTKRRIQAALHVEQSVPWETQTVAKKARAAGRGFAEFDKATGAA